METTSNQCCHSTSTQVSTASGALTKEPTEAHTGACCSGEAPETQYGYASNKEAHLKRLRRIEGQVRGISRMVEEDVYCIDVLTQISAATKALQAVSLGLLEDHMSHCVLHAAQAGDEEGTAKIREASDAIARLVRS